MGRVKRYNKIKACDPFAKRKKKEIDTVHDEPPDLFEERVEKDRKRKDRFTDDENHRELMLQREALRAIKEEEEKRRKHEKVIEGKRSDETMKDFKQRIRQETRLTLRDELRSMTSTAKKRKERLKERKQTRKLKKKGGNHEKVEEDVMEFSAAANGRLRPSDLGATSSFERYEKVGFGDRNERPPDLDNFAQKLKRKKKDQEGATEMEMLNQNADADSMGGPGDDEASLPFEDGRSGSSNSGATISSSSSSSSSSSKRSKKKAMKSLSDLLDVDDDGSSRRPQSQPPVLGSAMVTRKGGVGTSGSGALSTSVGIAASERVGGIVYGGSGGAKASASEMEELRARVQAAYRELKVKRQAKSGGVSFLGLGSTFD